MYVFSPILTSNNDQCVDCDKNDSLSLMGTINQSRLFISIPLAKLSYSSSSLHCKVRNETTDGSMNRILVLFAWELILLKQKLIQESFNHCLPLKSLTSFSYRSASS